MTRVGVYFQSWSSKWSSQHLDLESVEGDVIYLAFVKPDCNYQKGQYTFSGTGLDFSSDFKVVRDAITVLKNNGKTVMLSVGGATYGFGVVKIENLVALQKDLNCDGIDIDWEPTTNDPDMFTKLLKLFGQHKIGYLSAAVFSIGAYGEGQWANATPQGMYTGMNRKGLIEAGDTLDWINIMSYDASDAFNPTEAFMAYKSIFKKDIYLGFEVGQQAWGGALLTIDQVKTCGSFVVSQQGHFFVWSWQKEGNPNTKQVIDILKSLPMILTPSNPPPPPTPAPTIPLPPLPPKETGTQTDPVDCTCTCHPKIDWREWTVYQHGHVVMYQGQMYTCRQAHTSQPDWTPTQTPALWK